MKPEDEAMIPFGYATRRYPLAVYSRLQHDPDERKTGTSPFPGLVNVCLHSPGL